MNTSPIITTERHQRSMGMGGLRRSTLYIEPTYRVHGIVEPEHKDSGRLGGIKRQRLLNALVSYHTSKHISPQTTKSQESFNHQTPLSRLSILSYRVWISPIRHVSQGPQRKVFGNHGALISSHAQTEQTHLQTDPFHPQGLSHSFASLGSLVYLHGSCTILGPASAFLF